MVAVEVNFDLCVYKIHSTLDDNACICIVSQFGSGEI